MPFPFADNLVNKLLEIARKIDKMLVLYEHAYIEITTHYRKIHDMRGAPHPGSGGKIMHQRKNIEKTAERKNDTKK